MTPTPFILLYFISGASIYTHYQPKVLHGQICFENNSTLSGYDSCEYMKIITINNNIPSFFYKMNKSDEVKKFFKILFHFQNSTILDSNWIRKNIEKPILSEQTSYLNNLQCIGSFVLNVVMLATFLISLLVVIIIYHMQWRQP